MAIMNIIRPGFFMASLSIPFDFFVPAFLGKARTRVREDIVEADEESPRKREVRLHVCNDPAEALYVEMILDQEFIAHRREVVGTGPYGLTFVPQLGFCTVVVQDEDAERAMVAISEAMGKRCARER